MLQHDNTKTTDDTPTPKQTAVCYTFAVYCTVPLDPEEGWPEVSGKDLERQILKALSGQYRSPIDATVDLELMETEAVYA